MFFAFWHSSHMDAEKARALAIDLMKQHGLIAGETYFGLTVPWKFVWDDWRRRFGQCRFGKHEIGL